jgi:2-phosphoglycerate kinase
MAHAEEAKRIRKTTTGGGQRVSIDKPRSKAQLPQDAPPYSTGVTAAALMKIGLTAEQALEVGTAVEEALSSPNLADGQEDRWLTLVADEVRRRAGREMAENIMRWCALAHIDRSLVVLIGGATGAGKSVMASALASALGITRIVSTDVVREVLRTAFTAAFLPSLHVSSFEADRTVREPFPGGSDRLIVGFSQQAALVAVGVRALIDRAVKEGTDLVVEGVHLVPEFLHDVACDDAVIVPVLVTVNDQRLHRQQLALSAPLEDGANRYLKGFTNIRKIQDYIIESGRSLNMPQVIHRDFDTTLAQVIECVGRQAAIPSFDLRH